MVREGVYTVPSTYSFATSLTLAGYGGHSVELVSDNEEALEWSTTAEIALSNLTVGALLSVDGGAWALTGLSFGSAGGLKAESSQVSVTRTSFDGVPSPVVWLKNAQSQLTEVTIDNPQPHSLGLDGDALQANGGTLDLIGGHIFDAVERAITLRTIQASIQGVQLRGSDRPLLAAVEDTTVDIRGIEASDAAIGVFASNSHITVSHSTIEGMTTMGVLIGDNTHVEISDSTLSDCPDGHIAVLGPSTSVAISNIVATGADREACVSVTGTDSPVSLLNSTLQHCAGAGFSGYLASDVVLKDNDISQITFDLLTGEAADAISILDTQATIKDNWLHEVEGNGIAILRAQAHVEGNTIEETGSAGIDIVDTFSTRSSILNNSIEGAHAGGIVVLNAPAELIGNHIQDTSFQAAFALGEGIAFGMGADVIIEDNTIITSERSGVLFMDGATGSITNNYIGSNGRYGVLEFCFPGSEANDVILGENTFETNAYGPTQVCE